MLVLRNSCTDICLLGLTNQKTTNGEAVQRLYNIPKYIFSARLPKLFFVINRKLYSPPERSEGWALNLADRQGTGRQIFDG